MNTNTLATNVKQLRTLYGWSQYDLAQQAGIARPRISEIESGKNVKLDTIEKVAAALEVSAADLLSENIEFVSE